jgi:hypothetical protein
VDANVIEPDGGGAAHAQSELTKHKAEFACEQSADVLQ